MGVFFGTDGIRGKVNDDLSYDVAYKCGNAVAAKYPNAKILIGRDTRISGSMITLAFACGAMNGGATVTDIGVCPTAGISYLTNTLGYDLGVVISASHNPSEFNGIKVFDKNGLKLGDKKETELEKRFLKELVVDNDKIGTYSYEPRIVVKYENFLSKSIKQSLKGLTIVLDCSNGASYKLAPAVFRDNGARIIATYCKPDGLNINKDCGSLHTERLQRYVKKYKADMGFAFDGDSDRVIAVDDNGNVVDGDLLIYMLALDYKKQGKLNPSIVVGTRHTNMGVEEALKNKGIELIRTDIGDKYVSAKLVEKKLLIGGEQSGHIFVKDKLPTGDGILNALHIASICARDNKKLSSYFDFDVYKQCNMNVVVDDKMKVINSDLLAREINEEEKELENKGRIMIRLSGTEPCVRVMVETKDYKLSQTIATRLSNIIRDIDEEDYKCVE